MLDLSTDGSSRKKVLITSILFMGLSHLLYLKNYMKGIFFAFIEICFIVLLPTVIKTLNGLITLGEPHPELPVKLRDNSLFMLIDGVIILAIVAVFVIIYALSVKSALSDYSEFCIIKKFALKRVDFGGKAFPVVALAPTIAMVLFFVIVPLVFASLVAFTNYSVPDHIPPNNLVDWVGLDNFVFMFSGGGAWTRALGRVIIWTLVWALSATVTCYFGGMIMAVVLSESKLKITPVFRSVLILPYAIPTVITMLVWSNLLNGSFGTINRTLMALGIIKDVIPWLSNEWLAKFTVVMVNLWAGFPYFMLMTTGTMTAISADINEAARIDGANKFQIFRRITLPIVMYQTMPLIIMSFTHNINNFGAIFFLSQGWPKVADTTTTYAGGTDILVTWIYNLTVNQLKYHYASVLAVMIFVALAPFAIFNFMRTKSFKEGEL